MASITVVGTVTCKEGEEPCTLRTFESGSSLVTFSVLDKQYVYTKQGEDKFYQFYKCEVLGKAGEIALDRLQRGDKVGVSGQLVQRKGGDRVYLDIKNAQVTFLEYRESSSETPEPAF